MTVKAVVNSKPNGKADPIYKGNLVIYNGKVVLVTGDGSSSEYFAGTIVGGTPNIGTTSDGFIRDYWKQFLGTVTLEATL